MQNKYIIQVYNIDINKNNDISTNYHGLGDLIRGTLTLYKISKTNNLNLIVDISKHPISNFLTYKNTNYIETINNLTEVNFFFNYNNLIKFLNNILKKNDTVFIHTNAIYGKFKSLTYNNKTFLNEDENKFIKSIYNPNDMLNNYIQEKLKLLPVKFNIIHFRLDDKYFIKLEQLKEEYIIKIENIFEKFHEPNDVLLTNSIFLKNHLTNKYKCLTFDSKIIHLGLNNDNKFIMETLFEFFIQSHSQKIKTYSDYSWISGFCYWSSLIYDIELINMKI